MRTETNDTGLTASPDTDDVSDAGPERRCILTRATRPKAELVRLALGPDGQVAPDIRAKAPGRGAYIGVDAQTLRAAQAKGKLRGALAHAFKRKDLQIPDDLAGRIADALQRNALDRLGLEARGGTLVTGAEKIAAAARSGKVYLLLHAADAGEDGNKRLDQAWRVGGDASGHDLARGLVFPVGRAILSGALGRENSVHMALIEAGGAKRVREALARWNAFLTPDAGLQGAGDSAAGDAPAGTATDKMMSDEGLE